MLWNAQKPDHSSRVLSKHLLHPSHAWWRNENGGADVVPEIIRRLSGTSAAIPAAIQRSILWNQLSSKEPAGAQPKCSLFFCLRARSLSLFRKSFWGMLIIKRVCINCLLWNHCYGFAKISPIVHNHYFKELLMRKLNEGRFWLLFEDKQKLLSLYYKASGGRIMCSG